MNELWKWLVPDENDHNVEPADFFWAEQDDFFTNKSVGPFCDGKSDELRGGRKKILHTKGFVAKIEWRPTEEAK